MSVVFLLLIMIFAIAVWLAVIIANTLPGIIRNRPLYKSFLTREEQAKVELKLSRLSRVIVMCDRVDRPEHGFYCAVTDNIRNGVSYLFLVSHRATDENIRMYRDMFAQIEIAARADEKARALVGQPSVLPEKSLFEFHKLRQDWNDYPYICYEFWPAAGLVDTTLS